MSVPLICTNDTEVLDEIALRKYIAHRLEGKVVKTFEEFRNAVSGNGQELEFASQRQIHDQSTRYMVITNGDMVEVGVECDSCQEFYQPETLVHLAKSNGTAYCPKCKTQLYDVKGS